MSYQEGNIKSIFEEGNIKGDLKKGRVVAGSTGWCQASGLNHSHHGKTERGREKK